LPLLLHGRDQGYKLFRILHRSVQRFLKLYLVRLKVYQSRSAVDADALAMIGQLGHMAGSAVETRDLDSGRAGISGPGYRQANRQSVRVCRPGWIRQKSKALHLLEKRLAGLYAFQVCEQRVWCQLASLRQVIVFLALLLRPAVCAINEGVL